jgi:SAM-dependent MidA family methyltransferase
MERLDHFIARANAAYYARHDPFADFTTAPEIFQGFGEVLGAWAVAVWQAMGRPDPVILAEAGPGRGTLMADALRLITRRAPDFAAALSLHLVEASPRLRAIQAARLPGAAWHATVGELPPGPLVFLANEFLDALPIRQFVRRGAGWTERFVRAGVFVEQPAEAPEGEAAHGAAEGAVVETGQAAALVGALGARLRAQGGVALFLDYGPEASAPGDSLQALRGGAPADPLADPGSADLTAHVDFAACARAARAAGAAVHGPIAQGRFLIGLGLMARAQALARTRPAREAAGLIAAARRLVLPEAMGTLFKALAISHPDLPVPPGFARPA